MGRLKTQAQFLLECKDKAKDNVNLSSFVYINKRTKGDCNCNSCGNKWRATADSILSGKGCNLCGYKSSGAKNTFTKEQFIESSINRHGNKYDYSKSKYVNATTKIIISCKAHGDFNQLPYAHTYGQGCPTCYGGNQRQAYINLILDNDNCIGVKFGVANNFNTRVLSQNNRSKFKVVNLAVWVFSDSESCLKAEHDVKLITSPSISRDEMPDGHTETAKPSDIDMIIKIYEKLGGVKLPLEDL